MKFENLEFKDGCACCQPFKETSFKTVQGKSVHILQLPQEDGSLQYTIMIEVSDTYTERRFKLSEESISELISKL